MIKTVLFDLDGTLLPMDQDVFIKYYFGTLSTKLASNGYEAKKLINSILLGTEVMIKNNGEKNNEEVFWDKMEELYQSNIRNDEPLFEEYYKTLFDKVKESCCYNEKAKEVVELLKSKGYRIVLATNPIFPAIATNKRTKWAGLNIEDFEYITTYENSCYCKPNLKYYLEICSKLNLDPKECMMIGNDVSEDMIAQELGMDVFLVTDCLINRKEKDINVYKNGNFDDLLKYIKEHM